MVLSSTSYTPDEDFMVLVKALEEVFERIQETKEASRSFVFPRV